MEEAQTVVGAIADGTNVSSLVSFIVLIGLGAALYFFIKSARKSNTRLADFVNARLIDNFGLAVLFLIAGLNFSEGMMAASLHPEGTELINPVTRAVSHTTLAILGIIFMMFLPIVWVNWLDVIPRLYESIRHYRTLKEIRDRIKEFIGFGILCYVTAYIAITLPYYNLEIISIGFGGDDQDAAPIAFEQLKASLKFWTAEWWRDDYSAGYDFVATDYMSMYMLASWRIVCAHYVVTLFDGLYHLLFGNNQIYLVRNRSVQQVPPSAAGGADPTTTNKVTYKSPSLRDKGMNIDNVEDKILFLLRKMLPQHELNSVKMRNLVTQYHGILKNINEPGDKSALTSKVGRIAGMWLALGENSSISVQKRADEEAKLNIATLNLFSGEVSRGKGFESPLATDEADSSD